MFNKYHYISFWQLIFGGMSFEWHFNQHILFKTTKNGLKTTSYSNLEMGLKPVLFFIITTISFTFLIEFICLICWCSLNTLRFKIWVHQKSLTAQLRWIFCCLCLASLWKEKSREKGLHFHQMLRWPMLTHLSHSSFGFYKLRAVIK